MAEWRRIMAYLDTVDFDGRGSADEFRDNICRSEVAFEIGRNRWV